MSQPALPPFVSPEELNQRLGAADVRVVAVDEPDDFEALHIPTATRLAYADLTRAEPPVSGLMPAAGTVCERLSRIGLRPDEHVVAYDRTGGGQAGRLLFTLDALGHPGLSLLDGGLAAWLEAGLPTEPGAAADSPSDYRADYLPDRVADRHLILSRLDEPDFRCLDTRTPAEYDGRDVRAARGGHIPGAASLNWTELKDAKDRLRPRDTLLALLAEHGITPADGVVAYCQSHHRSSYAYFALRALGFTRVRGYPGAWSDWGNAGDTPVETT